MLVGRAEAHPPSPSVAFFYGKPVPVSELRRFDWVVVEPGNVAAQQLAALQRAGVQVFAYLSLGEAAPGSVDSRSALGRNAGWGTVIVDPSAEAWREHVLERAEALWQQGYQGLFLDTLDSYRQVLRGAEAQRVAAALGALIGAIHDRHPAVKLLFNRGFEILDDVGRLASGVAAESLLYGWDPAAKRYVEVPQADRDWLAGRLREVRDQLGVPIVVVDYLPPTQRKLAREAARRIEEMGFVPWISTPALDAVGVGSGGDLPERALLLHDGASRRDPAKD
jgi:hypothetical protein